MAYRRRRRRGEYFLGTARVRGLVNKHFRKEMDDGDEESSEERDGGRAKSFGEHGRASARGAGARRRHDKDRAVPDDVQGRRSGRGNAVTEVEARLARG